MARVCSVDGCDNKHRCRGFCNTHYRRWQRYGDPLGGRCTFEGDGLRFLEDAIRDSGNECILWPYAISIHGYGMVQWKGKRRNAHRVALILASGKDPKSLEAAHSCRNRNCVNIKHLRWATRSENQLDRVRDDTHLRGERNYKAKLTNVKVRAIRADTRTQCEIAESYGVTQVTVSHIKLRKSWAWLK